MPRSPLLPIGFVEPCQPVAVSAPPAGAGWLHEIKHDGYRLLVRRDRDRVRLWTRGGHDWAERFPAIAAAAGALSAPTFLIDGEAVASADDGVADFTRLRRRTHDRQTFLWAFDLLELDGEDLRGVPLERRKDRLAQLLEQAPFGIAYNDHHLGDGPALFAQACARGLEGIVSKRLGSRYRSGRSDDWLKAKNPASPAARREATEDWGKRGRR